MTNFELVWYIKGMHPSGTVDEARRLLGAGLCRPDGSFGLPYWHCTNEQCNRKYPSGRYEWFEATRYSDKEKEMRAKFIWDPEGGPCCNDKILEACIFCDSAYYRSAFPEDFLPGCLGELSLDDPRHYRNWTAEEYCDWLAEKSANPKNEQLIEAIQSLL